HQRIVTRIAGCELGNDPAGNGMMIASGNERCPGGRTERGRVVHVVAKAGIRDPLEVGCLDRASKGASRPEANVICQNQQNIGRSGRSLDTFLGSRASNLSRYARFFPERVAEALEAPLPGQARPLHQRPAWISIRWSRR